MATIVSIRLFAVGKTIDWLLFGSIITTGIFGFINVFFTLKYGQQLGLDMKQFTSDLDSHKFAKRVQAEALARGLMVLVCGVYGNVVRFLHPLTIEDTVFNEGLDILEAAILAA